MKTLSKRMDPMRRTSLIAGILYLFTFVSVPTLSLYGPLHNPELASSSDYGNSIAYGGILELIVGLTGIGTALALYPVLQLYSKRLALGLISARILEAATIFVGVAFVMGAAGLPVLNTAGESNEIRQALVLLYDKIFMVGQSLIPAIDDLILGYLFYKSGLIPRFLAIIGMLGAIPLLIGNLAVMFGFVDRISVPALSSALFVAFFEISIGLYLTFNGFKKPKETALQA